MDALNRLVFLIHPFCYANVESDAPTWPFALRERECAKRWAMAAEQMKEDEALVVVPVGSEHALRATESLAARARGALGQRCIVLRCPYLKTVESWDALTELNAEGVAAELRDAHLGQGQDWSKEELYTALHARLCWLTLQSELVQRGLCIDPSGLHAQAWGESFDGCVTKYSLNLRRLLGLRRAIEIGFDMAVPDARFLLDAKLLERVELTDDLQLFLFDVDGCATGLFVATSHSLADRPRRVWIPVTPDTVTVPTKQSGRLWPLPVEDRTPWPSVGLTEPPQELVAEQDGGLVVPVSAGFVYRLAKSPAYVMAGRNTPFRTFRGQLLQAKPV